MISEKNKLIQVVVPKQYFDYVCSLKRLLGINPAEFYRVAIADAILRQMNIELEKTHEGVNENVEM